jgi:hypothetical protein
VEVFNFKSTDGLVEINAVTGANQDVLWQRFLSRVGEEKALTYCNFTSTLQGELKLLNPLSKLFEIVQEYKSLPPVFYETAVYNFTLHFKGLKEKPQIIHKLKSICESSSIIELNKESGEYLISLSLELLNEPGIFYLNFRYTPKDGHTKEDSISFRVVSPKLDTKDDYLHILRDINNEYNEIVFQYLTKTVQNLSRGGRTDNDIIWLSIFRQVIDDYIKAVSFIVNKPHLRKTKEVLYSKAEKIKQWSPQLAEKYNLSRKRNTLDRDYFRHEVTINTNDTPENRFVKFSIKKNLYRLTEVIERILTNNSSITDEESNNLKAYLNKLNKLNNSPLFKNIKAEPLRNESIVLQKRNGYSQVYRYSIMLKKGIDLYEGSTHIGTRPIWQLYELWCFLKLRQMVANILDLDLDNPKQVEETQNPMLEPFKDNKTEHTVFYYDNNNNVIRLHYQHIYNRNSGDVHTATTENRPDIVLTIRKPDGFELTYLFDAKYQVNDDDEFSKEDKEEINSLKAADYPSSLALNQMHRYRDAIYYGEKNESKRIYSAKEIIGGYILFPGRGNDKAIKERYFYKSIESVNIGAFPLLPNHEDPNNEGTLLYEFLKKVLVEKTAYEQIKDSIPQHGLKYSRDISDSNELVLVGRLKNEEKEVIRSNKLYYVPIGLDNSSINIVSGFENTKYILLFSSTEIFLYELKGNAPKFVTKNDLLEIGFEPEGDYFLAFKIKSLIEVKVDGFDLSTNDLSTLDMFSKTMYNYVPYFTTFKELNKLRINY